MFGMGMPEIILILAIALIVIGPKKLPDIAKYIGRALGEFKTATQEIKNSINVDDTVDSIKKPFEEMGQDVKDTILSEAEATDTDAPQVHPSLKDPFPTSDAPPQEDTSETESKITPLSEDSITPSPAENDSKEV